MAKRSSKLSDFIDPSQVLKQFYKPIDFLGQELVLLNGERRSGRNGEYWHIKVRVASTGEEVIISHGGVYLRNFMELYSPSRDGEIRFKFVRDSNDPRMFVMVDPDT